MKNILIFLPNNLEQNNVGILEGFSKTIDNNLALYVTNNKLLRSSANGIGYCGESKPNNYIKSRTDSSEWIYLNNKASTVKVCNLNSNAGYLDVEEKVIVINYDYKAFKYSSVTSFKQQNYGEYFETLAKVIQHRQYNKKNSVIFLIYLFVLNLNLVLIDSFLKVYKSLSTFLCYSAIASHVNCNATTLKWALLQLKKERNLSLGVGNMMVSRLADFICGLVVLYFVVVYESELENFIQNITEYIIESLEELLNFLMGSPVGLKLNHALNKTLGNFFLYHISLWRTFLHACTPLLRLGLYLLVIPGVFGLSFQTALLSDIIAFSTLHIYCIYVYAARLYGLQVRGLISLWRLFIGRKYNPLRTRVDSYQYNHHQLVIGTLGFTILLFLLPTTLLYYTVFSVFRAGLVAFDGILIRMRYILQCLPLYVCILWIFNSYKVKGILNLSTQRVLPENIGAVRLKIDPTHECTTVQATLDTLSLWQSIINSAPVTLTNIPSVSWSLLFRSFTSGTLL